MPALKPYWGKPAVRNFRGGDGNGGIIRSPQRAIVLPDWRRFLTARLDAGMDAPERRSFSLEPFSHCRDNRQEIVCAALTLLRGFVNEGSPRTTSDRLASFEEWDSRIRQAVLWISALDLMPEGASLADPVSSIERAKRDEPEQQKLA